MSRMFGSALLALCVLQGLGCSADDNAPLHDGEGGPSIDVAGRKDSGVATARPTTTDTKPDPSATPGGTSKKDAATADASERLDASADAARAEPSSGGGTDASRAPGAGPDGSIDRAQRGSAGCGKSGRPAGGRFSKQGAYNYTFPEAYDGKEPYPLLLGFHAASNPIEQIENLTKGSDFETKYVRAFPKSKGAAWDYATDIGAVLAMYDELMANYCIDLQSVFATGHSSGAQLIAQLLTPAHKADSDHLQLKAVAPVAASRYGSFSHAIPVIYIQGQHDNVRNSDGSDVVKEFVSANGCMATSQPYTSAPSCMSSGKAVHNGCVQYDGCKVPTVWCSHDDPQYGNTSHGWPCFATKAIYDFFSALP